MTRIYNRHDTAANFATNNPTLGAGEIAIETDTYKVKIGDGATAYNSLVYFGGNINSTTVNNITTLTQAEYDALVTKDASTFYIIISANQ